MMYLDAQTVMCVPCAMQPLTSSIMNDIIRRCSTCYRVVERRYLGPDGMCPACNMASMSEETVELYIWKILSMHHRGKDLCLK